MADTLPPLAFIGGTGPEGRGLALRLAATGHPVILGSRDAARAQASAAEVNALLGSDRASGATNLDASAQAEIVFLVVPYAGQAETLPSLAEALAGKVVITAVVPLSFEGGRPSVVSVPEGSAAPQAALLLPASKLAAAYHHLSAKHLADLAHPMEGDVLVCADDAEAKQTTMDLTARIPDLRPIDAGGLANANTVEAMTALLLGINRRYKVSAGVRIVGI